MNLFFYTYFLPFVLASLDYLSFIIYIIIFILIYFIIEHSFFYSSPLFSSAAFFLWIWLL
jgi:hypothetical protein